MPMSIFRSITQDPGAMSAIPILAPSDAPVLIVVRLRRRPTVAGFRVSDIGAAVGELCGRGVTFEESTSRI